MRREGVQARIAITLLPGDACGGCGAVFLSPTIDHVHGEYTAFGKVHRTHRLGRIEFVWRQIGLCAATIVPNYSGFRQNALLRAAPVTNRNA